MIRWATDMFRSVRDLARLSLKDPVFVSAHEHLPQSTPENLSQVNSFFVVIFRCGLADFRFQSYVVCADEYKFNIIWSFLKNHKDKKIIIFLTSCKQVSPFFYIFSDF